MQNGSTPINWNLEIPNKTIYVFTFQPEMLLLETYPEDTHLSNTKIHMQKVIYCSIICNCKALETKNIHT